MFLAPFEQGGDFRDAGILGIKRFLDRIFKLISDIEYPVLIRQNATRKMRQAPKEENDELNYLLHQTIKKVSEDIENLRFNTAISALMILFNAIEKNRQSCDIETLKLFLKILAPFAPYLSEELYQKLNAHQKKTKFESIHQEEWPKYNKNFIKKKNFELIIQINGKMRDTILAKQGISQKEAGKKALSSDRVKILIAGKEIKKVIFVPDRLINFVI